MEIHDRIIILSENINALEFAMEEHKLGKVQSNVNSKGHLNTLRSIQDEYVNERVKLCDILQHMRMKSEE